MSDESDDVLWALYKRGVKRLQSSKPVMGADKTTAVSKRTPQTGVGKSFSLVRKTSFSSILSPAVIPAKVGIPFGWDAVENRRDSRFPPSPKSYGETGRGNDESLAALLETNTPLDRRTERALRHGEVAIEARLDLHGLTESEAYASLISFIPRAAREGKKWLLIITGKGREGRSVLRANFPRWCADKAMASLIVTLRQASPCHGGEGAFYVRLKKTKAP